MSSPNENITWKTKAEDIIVLVNRSQHNYILELPSGRMRLDAGRRMRTLRSILKIQQIQELVDAGNLAVER